MSRPVRVRVMTRDQFREFLGDARDKGLDQAEATDRAGVLVTPERKIEIERAALEQLADVLEAIPVHQILPRAIGANPADTKKAIEDFIRNATRKVA